MSVGESNDADVGMRLGSGIAIVPFSLREAVCDAPFVRPFVIPFVAGSCSTNPM